MTERFIIINKQILSSSVKRLDIKATQIARWWRPGQLVMVVPEEGRSPVPLAVMETDAAKGTVAVVVDENDPLAARLSEIPIKEPIFAVYGPVGEPVPVAPGRIRRSGSALHVICAASGPGIAHILAICRHFKQSGCRVTALIGGATKSAIMLEPQIRLACHRNIVVTEDGTYQRKGTLPDLVKECLAREPAGRCVATAPPEDLEAICRHTKSASVTTLVSLSTPMICANGMCGSCRVRVGRDYRLACLEGPLFDGHKVDWADYRHRKTLTLGDREVVPPPAPAGTASAGLRAKLTGWMAR